MKQILIADTRKENLLKARLILENSSIIFPARTKNWMMKVLRQKNIDLVIINVRFLEKESVCELISTIRKSEKYSNLQFIVTGKNTKEDIVAINECMKMRCCEAVSLPFDFTELVDVVSHM